MSAAKGRGPKRAPKSDDLRPEYDLRQLGPGVRGKYYKRAIAGPIVVGLVPDSALAEPKRKKRKAAARRK